MKRLGLVALVGLVAGLLAAPGPAQAASPKSGRIGSGSKSVTWSGGPFTASNPAACVGASDPTCDHFLLQVDRLKSGTSVQVAVAAPAEDDYDLYVYGPDGTEVGNSANPAGTTETVTIAKPQAGTYEVRVQPFLVNPGSAYTGTARAVKGDPGSTGVDTEEECLEPVPAAASPGLTPDSGGTIGLEVAVLTDGVSVERAQQAFEVAKRSYEPLGIALKGVSFTPVTFADNGMTTDVDGNPRASGDASRLIEDSKAFFGGARPAGADLVYLLTNKDIYDGGDPNTPDDPNRNYGVAGLADCIGGVRYSNRAFAVGELFDEEFTLFGTGQVRFYYEATAKIVAHELGHLMGGHHHYANCVEGIPSEMDTVDVSPCTLMSNFVDFQSLNFSTLNSAVVRGHATEAARP